MTPARLPILLWHLGRRGGGPRYTYELARALLERDDVLPHLALSRQSELHAASLALGVPTTSIDTYQSLPGFLTGFARLPAIGARLRRTVEQHRIPVALCAMTHVWNPFLTASLKRGGALNGLVVHDASAHPGESHWIHRQRIALDIRQTDAVIALSDAVRGQLVSDHGLTRERIGLSWHPPFRHGAATARRARRLTGAPVRLLFFGRLLPYKGLEELLAAMAILRQRNLPVTLRIVGQGPAPLPDPAPPGVAIERGWVAEEAIADIFAGADLLVVPYQEASQSGVISIARHAGLPALVTPVGGLVEQVDNGKSGFIASGTDPAAIAQAIEGVLGAPEAYAQISAALLADDSDANWARAADGIVTFLRGVLAERGNGMNRQGAKAPR